MYIYIYIYVLNTTTVYTSYHASLLASMNYIYPNSYTTLRTMIFLINIKILIFPIVSPTLLLM